ncbi:MAG: DNA translocase FtsK [Eubacteriales bacterium]|nr:DNA translocase FtsK [Eubacteriales bacterium]MDD3539782.1 DNA translocase FtsK [Eubacteriales bacterium]
MLAIDERPGGKLSKRQRRDILGILFLAAALLLAFSLYAPATWTGWLGRTLSTVTAGLFGTIALVLPLILLLFSLMFFLQKEMAVTTRQAGALFLLFLVAAAFISLFSLPLESLLDGLTPAPEGKAAGFHLISELWRYGRFPEAIREGNHLSGGLLGGLVAHSLERVAGLTGALILLFAFLVTVLVVAFGLSPSKMGRWAATVSEKLPEASEMTEDEPSADALEKEADRGLFSRLFQRRKKDITVEENLEEEKIPPTRGPKGWESFVSQDSFEGEKTAEGLNFPKPPPGYRRGMGETRPKEPLTGVPYLFSHKGAPKPISHLPELPRVDERVMRTPEVTLDKKLPERKKTVRRYRPEQQMSMLHDYRPPPMDLLKEDSGMKKTAQEIREIRELGRKLEETLDSFGVEAKIVNYTTGPTITRFELAPGPGIKVSRIVNLSDDIALSLAAMGVRIEAPIPGKAAIGIEIPNKKMRSVLLRSLLESDEFQKEKSPLVAALGRDVGGEVILCDLGKMPHLLIAGATGSGKSVCINSILMSILYRSSPEDVRMLMIDPKIVELNVYNGIPHLLQPVVTDPEKAYGVLNYAVSEMERRYRLFADQKVRDIASYNAAVRKNKYEEDDEQPVPYIVIVIDELADLMALTQHQVESAISRLMAKARAVGIHVIIATQRPSVDVITGVIKANIPSRLAFAVASQVDSRTILDSVGAEKLLGRGDMLYFPLGSIKAIRGQGAFVSNSEVERVLSFIKSYYPENYDDTVGEAIASTGEEDKGKVTDSDEDELLMDALRVVVEADYAAVSLIQRKLQVGYPRAARLVDRLHELGFVGPFEGSKPRKVLVTPDQFERMLEGDEAMEGGDIFD